MMMKIGNFLNKWLITIWLMMGVLCSPVRVFAQVSQPAAWTTTPTLSQDVRPAYQFHSTSAYTPIVGKTRYISAESYNPIQPTQSAPQRHLRKGMDDEDPDGQEIGLIDTPIGEIPFAMIALMAGLYAILHKKRKKKQKNVLFYYVQTIKLHFF